MKKNLTLLLIDSGIGGFSILQKIKKIIPENIECIYLMDNKEFPYGNKNYIFITKRIINIIKYFNKKKIIILIIIACNTASSIGIKYIKKIFNIPIIGTTPNIKKAIKKTKTKKIAILGTYVTLTNKNIINKIKKIPNSYKIYKKYSYFLVEQAEKKIIKNKINKKKFKNIFNNWIYLKNKIDTIIIGCTHFHFLKKEFNLFFKKKIIYIDNIEKIKKNTIKIINFYKNKKSKNKKQFFSFFYTKKIKKNFINILINKYKFNYIKYIFINT